MTSKRLKNTALYNCTVQCRELNADQLLIKYKFIRDNVILRRKTELRFPRQQRHELITISRDVEQAGMRSHTPRPSPHCATNRAFQEIEQNIITNANAGLPTISTTAADRESNALHNEAIYSEPEGSAVYAITSRSPSVMGVRPT